jgi:MoxR-like ATPase
MAYKNPPVHSQFKKGHVGNPGGKTSEQRKAEIRNAELATKIRTRMLEAVQATLQDDTSTANAIARIEANILKLIKDSEDRGLGQAKAAVDVSNEDGSLQQGPILEAVLAALAAKHGPKPS